MYPQEFVKGRKIKERMKEEFFFFFNKQMFTACFANTM